jgi:hypothetical protein
LENEEDMFGDESTVEVVEEDESQEDLMGEFLKTDGVTIGGNFLFSAKSKWYWDLDEFGDSLNPDNELFDIDLDASLYFDARPVEDLRFFGKIVAGYPFDDGNIFIKELFSEFNWDNKIYFRGGKHMISWGVGYFFSPGDILNLSLIDPQDPEAEREGPISLKTNIPFGTNNINLYVISLDIDKPYELALAPKYEFLINETEIGIGGAYQQDIAPMGMITITTPLIGDFDFFGEAVISYGANRTYVKEIIPVLETYTEDDTPYFSGTAGISYRKEDKEGNFTLNLAAQYYYNGEGYEDAEFVTNNRLLLYGLAGAGILKYSDIAYTGQHYGAGNISWIELFNTKLTSSLFWIGNLSDGSGQIESEISYEFFDYMDWSFSIPIFYGEEGDEFSFEGPTLGVTLQATFGSGNF